jgi:hypothetical protein
MSNHPSIAEKPSVIDAIRRYVAEASALIDAGESNHLDTLDAMVTAISERVATMTSEEAKRVAPDLADVMASVENLQQKMEAAKAEIAAAITTIGTQKRATHAYKNTPSTGE